MRKGEGLGLVLTALCAAGCVEVAKSRPVARFPSPDEVAGVQPVPIKAAGHAPVVVDRWDFDLASIPAPVAAASPDDVARMRALVPNAEVSAALACAARAHARVLLERGVSPDEAFNEYAAARCGSTTTHVTIATDRWKNGAALGDDELLARTAKSLGKAAITASPNVQFGAAIERKDEDAVVAIAVTRRDADVDAWTPPSAEEKYFWVRGATRGPVDGLYAAINRGRYAFKRCARDPIPPPRFAFRCPLDKDDAAAWVDVVATPRGSLLSEPLARVLAVRDGAAAPWESPRDEAASTSDATAFSRAVLDHINVVRDEAKLGALSASVEQSQINARLSGALFNAELSHDRATADRLALSLLAGWGVRGAIREGNVYTALAPGLDPRRWVRRVVDYPFGRMVLLDPNKSVIAVGSSLTESGDGAGAAVTTYALYDARAHAADKRGLYAALDAERAAKGLGPSVETGFDEAERAAAQVAEGVEPMEAARSAVARASERLGKAVAVWVFETTSLEALKLPKELLDRTPPRVAFAVTHHRVPGAAWGQYVVFVFAVDLGRVQEARAGSFERD